MKPYRGFVSYVRPASDPSPNCQLITRFGDADAAIAALPMLALRRRACAAGRGCCDDRARDGRPWKTHVGVCTFSASL